MDANDMRLSGYARNAYHAYAKTTGWRNYQGLPMPAWEQLGDTIQDAWRSAVYRVWQQLDETARQAD